MLTRGGRRLRSAIKRFLYSQLYMRDALLIAFGRSKPLVRFTVEATPPSIYLNFAIPAERVAALERELRPPHPLTPIACLEGDAPFHCLTLNVYRVSGLANGIRAEWSTYVRDPGGVPRYLVVEAQTEKGSIDPVGLITRPGPISYTDADGQLGFEVGSEGGTKIRAQLARPERAPLVRAAPQWVRANDYIYWMNGVCDRTFYDAGLADARARRVDAADVRIEDDTRWSRIVEPAPRSVVVFEDAIEFAISPWWNLDELAR